MSEKSLVSTIYTGDVGKPEIFSEFAQAFGIPLESIMYSHDPSQMLTLLLSSDQFDRTHIAFSSQAHDILDYLSRYGRPNDSAILINSVYCGLRNYIENISSSHLKHSIQQPTETFFLRNQQAGGFLDKNEADLLERIFGPKHTDIFNMLSVPTLSYLFNVFRRGGLKLPDINKVTLYFNLALIDPRLYYEEIGKIERHLGGFKELTSELITTGFPNHPYQIGTLSTHPNVTVIFNNQGLQSNYFPQGKEATHMREIFDKHGIRY